MACLDGAMIRQIIAELATPSNQVGPLDRPYRRALIGIGHAVFGASCVSAAPGYGLYLGLVFGAAYWLYKERGDLLRGGGIVDGLEDAVMVSLGAWYGPWWWPGVVILCGGYLMVMAARVLAGHITHNTSIRALQERGNAGDVALALPAAGTIYALFAYEAA